MKSLDEQIADAEQAVKDINELHKTKPMSLVELLAPYVHWNNLLQLKLEMLIEKNQNHE